MNYAITTKTLATLTETSTLGEIKRALQKECEKATYPITETDWNAMITEILYELAIRKYA